MLRTTKLIFLTSLALTACDKKSVTTTTTGAESPSATDSKPFDQQFVDMMVPHHEQALDMAQVALTRATHPELQDAARKIIQDQQREIAQLKQYRAAWFGSDQTPSKDHMPMLPGMEGHPQTSHAAMMQKLTASAPFDKAFLDMMIEHHQMAVHAAQLEKDRGARAELKALAEKVHEDQQKEIQQFERWRAAWYPATP